MKVGRRQVPLPARVLDAQECAFTQVQYAKRSWD
jgi:hypothetical protein